MATVKTFGKEYRYVLECEQNHSIEKLLKFLESKSPELFGHLVFCETITENKILDLINNQLSKAKEEKTKQRLESILVHAKDLIKNEKKRETNQTTWHYKLPTLEAAFSKDEEVTFEESVDIEGKRTSISRLIPANEVKKQISIIKASLVRVENLFTDEKKPKEWPTDDSQQDEFIAALPHTWRVELADVFRQAAIISEDVVKN